MGFKVTEQLPPDPIFALTAKYVADTDPRKVNLGVGAYRSNDGLPWVLPVVHETEEQMVNDAKQNHEYLPIAGLSTFVSGAARLILGPDVDLSTVTSVQTLSGTGANHLAAELLKKFNSSKTIWVSDPTWGNHYSLFSHANLEVKKYPYWDAEHRALAFDRMIQTLESETKSGDIVLLHACAHNPTGVDPTHEQWDKILEVVKSKGLFAFFDSAYQGFASGDLDADAWALRHFIAGGVDVLVCQSFSKNMGLYGERAGALHVLPAGRTKESAQIIKSQLEALTRAELSTCPAHGAEVASRILSSPQRFKEWKGDIVTMSQRIIDMRAKLRSELERLQTPGTWNHITDQIGMFSYTGLTPEQVHWLVNDRHIYFIPNGRISMAGLNESNVKYVAQSFHDAIIGSAHL